MYNLFLYVIFMKFVEACYFYEICQSNPEGIVLACQGNQHRRKLIAFLYLPCSILCTFFDFWLLSSHACHFLNNVNYFNLEKCALVVQLEMVQVLSVTGDGNNKQPILILFCSQGNWSYRITLFMWALYCTAGKGFSLLLVIKTMIISYWVEIYEIIFPSIFPWEYLPRTE